MLFIFVNVVFLERETANGNKTSLAASDHFGGQTLLVPIMFSLNPKSYCLAGKI